MTTDPLDAPPLRDRLVLLRTLCGGLMLGLLLVTSLIVATVWFALDGQPIAGNAVRLGGVSAVTLAAAAVALVAPPVGVRFARRQAAAELAALGPDAPLEERLTVFSTRTFLEYAPAISAGAACALSYHLTADGLLLAAVGGLELFLAARFPTRRRVAGFLAPIAP